MYSLFIYPNKALWEIVDSVISGIDMLAQEVCIGMCDVFQRLYYSSEEDRTNLQKNTSVKESAFKSSLNIAVKDIIKYQLLESGRTTETLLSSAIITDFASEKDTVTMTIEVRNKAGNIVDVPIEVGV